jgi:hypothetical protein
MNSCFRISPPLIGLCLALVLPAAQAGSSLTVSETRDVPGDVLGSASGVASTGSDSRIRSLELERDAERMRAQQLRVQLDALKLRFDALGASAGTGSALEERLLKAVNDLRVASQGREQLASALGRLVQAVGVYRSSSFGADPDASMYIEAMLRESELVLAPEKAVPLAAAVAASVTDALVVSVNGPLSLAIINVGSRHGVRQGMPFSVVHDGSTVAVGSAVDVRGAITGLSIQSFTTEKRAVSVGDRIRVEASRLP